MATKPSAYAQLEAQFAEMNRIDGIAAILHWDAAVSLPEHSVELRSDQLAWLAGQSHAIITSTKLGDLLAQAQAETSNLDDWQRANLHEMHHRYTHENCLDAALVEAVAKTASESERIWRSARKNNDFNSFAPTLEKMIGLTKQVAAAKADALGLSPYDALLDSYDPTTRSADIDILFANLEAFLPNFIHQVIETQAANPHAAPHVSAAQSKQKKLAHRIMKDLGFPFDSGRLDTSTHPFCGGVPDDIRITTRYNPHDVTESLYGVLHETGHALYEAGLPHTWRKQPVGQARGMSMHESQSLFIEMQLAQSPAFCAYLAPLMHTILGLDITPDALYHNITHVKRSLIRVSADEVTYPTHIILRYRLEKALLSGDLQVKDLPAAWADMQEHLLGIHPDSDANGCLQDIHWPEGAIGYFPTYTLGAMIAAQLMNTLRSENKELDAQLTTGNFTPTRNWLNQNIHAKASSQSMQETLIQATGKPLDSADYIAHLKTRYLP